MTLPGSTTGHIEGVAKSVSNLKITPLYPLHNGQYQAGFMSCKFCNAGPVQRHSAYNVRACKK